MSILDTAVNDFATQVAVRPKVVFGAVVVLTAVTGATLVSNFVLKRQLRKERADQIKFLKEVKDMCWPGKQ